MTSKLGQINLNCGILRKGFWFLAFALLISGCTTYSVQTPPLQEPPNRIYKDNYEKVWRAAQQTLRKYPVKINNMDSGILETDWIKNDKLFSLPLEGKQRPGVRYKLTFRIVKGKVEGDSATKVTCIKTVEAQRDFFSGFESVRPDGLEEATMLYRIGRFLMVEKVINRGVAPSTTSPTDSDDS